MSELRAKLVFRHVKGPLAVRSYLAVVELCHYVVDFTCIVRSLCFLTLLDSNSVSFLSATLSPLFFKTAVSSLALSPLSRVTSPSSFPRLFGGMGREPGSSPGRYVWQAIFS